MAQLMLSTVKACFTDFSWWRNWRDQCLNLLRTKRQVVLARSFDAVYFCSDATRVIQARISHKDVQIVVRLILICVVKRRSDFEAEFHTRNKLSDNLFQEIDEVLKVTAILSHTWLNKVHMKDLVFGPRSKLFDGKLAQLLWFELF